MQCVHVDITSQVVRHNKSPTCQCKWGLKSKAILCSVIAYWKSDLTCIEPNVNAPAFHKGHSQNIKEQRWENRHISIMHFVRNFNLVSKAINISGHTFGMIYIPGCEQVHVKDS